MISPGIVSKRYIYMNFHQGELVIHFHKKIYFLSETQSADSSVRVEHSEAWERSTFWDVQASKTKRSLYGSQ